jgi:hypothetical protein
MSSEVHLRGLEPLGAYRSLASLHHSTEFECCSTTAAREDSKPSARLGRQRIDCPPAFRVE